MIVAGDDVARFVSERLAVSIAPPFTTLGIERDGKIVAGVILHFFEGANIFVSAAGEGWTRGFFRELGAYVFDRLGCERMTAVTRDCDVAAFVERLGGRVEGRMRSHFGAGHDGILAGVLRDEWRY